MPKNLLIGEPESSLRRIHTYEVRIHNTHAHRLLVHYRDWCNCRPFQESWQRLGRIRISIHYFLAPWHWGAWWRRIQPLSRKSAPESLYNESFYDCLFLFPETTKKPYYSVIMIIQVDCKTMYYLDIWTLAARQKSRASAIWYTSVHVPILKYITSINTKTCDIWR